MVLIDNDTSLSVFSINGQSGVANGDTVTVPYLTTSVTIVATPNNPDATVSSFTIPNPLVTGSNTLTFTVTATDTVDVGTYTVNINVRNSNTDLSAFTVTYGGITRNVLNNGSINIPYQTTSVTVVATPAVGGRVGTITGATGLVTGNNTITFTVTAPDGITKKNYSTTLHVTDSNTTLSTFTINGTNVTNGGTFTVPYQTSSVSVVATTSSAGATKSAISGTTGLATGNNTVSFTVTSAEGGSTQNYSVTVRVTDSNTSLSVFKLNGTTVTDGGTFTVPYLTSSVTLLTTTASILASVSNITGTTGLVTGDNTVSFRVTSAEGGTIQNYRVTVHVTDSNTSLSVFKLNGTNVTNGGTFTVPYLTTSVTLLATPASTNTITPATVSNITGTTGLVTGNNTVSFIVTSAEGGTTQNYSVTVRVTDSNTSLSVFTVNGNAITNSGSFTVAYQTTSVIVVATPASGDALRSSIVGATNLHTGNNTVSFTVTAADGVTTQNYSITVIVTDSNTTLSVFTVNGSPVTNGATFSVPYQTTSVVVVATTSSINASKSAISGTSGLHTGNNTVSFRVTAADFITYYDYSVIIHVIDSNTDLSMFKVNGTTVENGGTFTVPYLTTSVTVIANTASASASRGTINGTTGLVTGDNTVSFTVTSAEGGTTKLYSITVHVTDSNVSLSLFTVDGINVVDGDIIIVPYQTPSVVVLATPADNGATRSQITGTTGLVTGDNTVRFSVTSQEGGTVKNYTVIIRVTDSNVSLAILTVDGTNIANGGTFTVPYLTRTVTVVAIPMQEKATLSEILGTTGLVTGTNTVSFSLTAEDGITVQEYSFIVIVTDSNTDLSLFTINGIPVTDNDKYTVPYQTPSVNVVAEVSSVDATISEITGTTGLLPGINNIVSFTVTAGDLVTTKTYHLTVQVLGFICFHEDSKILCQVDGSEVYVPIKNIRKGTLVKTLSSGFKAVDYIGHSQIYNPSHKLRAKNRLYKLTPRNYPDLKEDLIITGCHAVLVDKLTEKETEKTIEYTGKVYYTENKTRLIACLDARAEPFMEKGIYTIWHLSLENENYHYNYGIYANGLLVESASQNMMRELSGMQPVE
jgi:hypothetical protein